MTQPRQPATEALAGAEPPPARPTVPLSQLRQGERGTLHAADLCCDDCELLNAMGMTEQCEIRVCQRGEPCIVQVRSTRLGISAAMAQRIFVAPCQNLAR